ncbi:UDP-2,3-diacylglucosamine diphosphatase LpxI [Xinfangfangia sp. CPCC 101601]|uniref:UDP-2,3-diacylglucosamine diphosphatase LpxI n=1 Tax=Pseudogemmobacter lacusdianii TaxID=3069608 RepID=A0ABU0W4M7_9RHOB|nr:UDP-2,3-diacylglucosamine diphosphatase LpxI [Xinfangfangia sp. CPCC 101601]MDQ2068010.1 UDP-2,3-diacylglucosamine diphosphatase LpxI [Xinfangfangia sp. CPCC 101601]
MTLAIIAGAGALPAALVAALPQRPFVAALDGYTPVGVTPDLSFRIERLYPFFAALHEAGVTQVTFAGAVQRPRLDPSLFDVQTAQIVPRLMQSLAQGDDATLREVIALFEEEGFAILGVSDVAPDLVPGEGLYAGALTPRDEADATRAAAITEALGRVDVGQGCVVAQGLCLGAESLAGTDAMLAQVEALPGALRPAAAAGRGLLYKAPKPLQDRRIDLPALGPDAVRAAAKAGLGGIAWEAGGVLTLDLPQMQALAAEHGLFLWARRSSRG